MTQCRRGDKRSATPDKNAENCRNPLDFRFRDAGVRVVGLWVVVRGLRCAMPPPTLFHPVGMNV
ncbi:MAG: hypothetical protein LBT09_03600 [Planctomycetaceae bacterium]|nr:hypothetical protein [Planctomycetaceae bacterium]